MAPKPAEAQKDEAMRQRRLGDAAKLIPVLAAVLMFLPGLWALGTATSSALIYIFSVWGVLIVLIAVLSRSLAHYVRRAEDRRRDRSSGS
jgi:fatty acid desaturase